MKLSLFAHELSAAASWAARLAPSRPAIPVLAAVLIEADNTLRLSATDFETFATVTVTAATIGEPGKLAVSAHLLSAVAKTLPATAEVSLESSGKGLSLRCGRLRATLPEVPAEDWPTFPQIGLELGQVASPVLSKALSRVLPVVPPASEAISLTGVLFDRDADGGLTLVGADAPRLAAAPVDWQPTLGDAPAESLIVPASLLRSAGEGVNGGSVTVHSDGATLTLRTAAHTVTGRLIAGQYKAHNWRTLLDTPVSNLATTATVDTAALRQAVEQVAAVREANAKAPELVRLAVTADGIGVSLAGTAKADVATGEGATEVDAHSFAGEPITVGVAAQFALDALRCLGSPMATLTFTADATKPFLLTASDEKGALIEDGYRHLIVPRRIAEAG